MPVTPRVEQVIEAICLLGCERVNDYIRALQNGDTLAEYALLDTGQRASLLQELRAIMSVYTARA